eukprot:TRINITY_DN65267_c0_g1_i1.p1 TRINITY_DN65267_c0_g1~~TRINITY_DN65267_c0_g1_i1.p1  ORF type:complete len:201 (+),score=51.36 TRINITY_DN65267_c0_g1_i1:73-603(+)
MGASGTEMAERQAKVTGTVQMPKKKSLMPTAAVAGAITLPAGVRKRDVRLWCRAASLVATCLMGLHLLSMHYASPLLCKAGAVIMVMCAVANQFASYTDEGSVFSWAASMVDICIAAAAGIAYLLAVGAEEIPSPALSGAVTLLSMVCEFVAVSANLFASCVGFAAEDTNNKTERK